MTNLESLRRAWGDALRLCEFFGWDAEELYAGLTPYESGQGGKRSIYKEPAGSDRGRLERLAVELANSLREKLHQAEEDAFWNRGAE